MTRKDKKRLVQIITLSCLALVVILVAVPYIKKYQRYNRQIASYQEKILQAEQRIINKPALQEEIAKADGLLDTGKMFIIAPTQEQADAQLAQFMRKIVTDVGAELEQTKKTTGQGAAVGLDTRFTATTEGFVEILRAISEHRPVINVTSVIVSPLSDKRRVKEGRRTKIVRELNGKLKVTLTVEAFFTTEADSFLAVSSAEVSQ